MSKRLSFYGLVCLGSLCLVFLLFNQRYSGYLEHRLQPLISVGKTWEEAETRSQPIEIPEPIMSYVRGINDNGTLAEIHQVIDHQRRLVENDMKEYRFPNGNYNISATRLQDLVMENGGTPVRSILLTTWRSGSTFFGDILNAHPANYYHYEPLLDFGIVQVRGMPLAGMALANLKALLNCEYGNLDHYLEYGKNHVWLFNHNAVLWKQCLVHRNLCWDPRFLDGFCKLFPFQSMKIVRLRLKLAQELLADKKLGVRMVLLVRDPRGTLQSRKHREWCPGNSDCSDPAVLCEDMVSDFYAAAELRQMYPNTFRVIRYEDLSVDIYKNVKELFQFYGREFHGDVMNFLDTHTKNNVGGVSSTFRNSKEAPFHWRADLDFEEVEGIQRSCMKAMQYWGYVAARNATHQKEFHPIKDYKLELPL